LTLLPAEERARAESMDDLILSRRWRRARIALRLVLATHVGLEQARAPLVVSPRGKPRLALPGAEFSLSHSGGLLLLAVSSSGPLGVDIETRTTVAMDERRRAAIERAATALAPHAPLPSSSVVQRFLQAWTRLEAVAKATGTGIGQVLTELAITGPASGLEDRQVRSAETMLVAEGRPLRVEDLMLDGQAVAAIAVPRDAEIDLHTFTSSPIGASALETLAQSRG
jgi:4'-phosphopantetheinyl transferase